MAKRNYKVEIKQLKERGEFDLGIFNTRIYDLKESINILATLNKKDVDELYKYLPIACVACIESFFRSAIQQLIDKGGVYFDNLNDLTSQIPIKIDFDIISSLHSKQFTLGELVSHLLPCNNINTVNSCLSKIIGKDFLETLKTHEPLIPGGGGIDKDLYDKFNNNYALVLQSVERLFELRHIFCHESSISVSVNRAVFEEDLSNCEIFLEKSSALIFTLIYEDWGISYKDQLSSIEKEFEKKLKELNTKITDYKKRAGQYSDNRKKYNDQFEKTVKYWYQYAESKATLKSISSSNFLWSKFAYYRDYIESIDDVSNELFNN